MTRPAATPTSGTPEHGQRRRDYSRLLSTAPRGLDRDAAMKWVVDSLWEAFSADRLSWIGFYAKTAGENEMILVARRDKPACSPLGLQGMCGRCWKERRAIVVDDVTSLASDNYIACDPRDKSEVVIPLFEPDGACWGVLDGDSHETHAFDDHDAAELTKLVETLSLSTRGKTAGGLLRL